MDILKGPTSFYKIDARNKKIGKLSEMAQQNRENNPFLYRLKDFVEEDLPALEVYEHLAELEKFYIEIAEKHPEFEEALSVLVGRWRIFDAKLHNLLIRHIATELFSKEEMENPFPASLGEAYRDFCIIQNMGALDVTPAIEMAINLNLLLQVSAPYREDERYSTLVHCVDSTIENLKTVLSSLNPDQAQNNPQTAVEVNTDLIS